MTAEYIKMCVAHYFRYDRQCPIVTVEYWHYQDSGVQPDVLVLDAEHRPIEIEAKVSLSDFKADAQKGIWRHHGMGRRWPWKFYYAIPAELEEGARRLLRPDCGLLRVMSHYSLKPGAAVSVSVTAPKHADYDVVDNRKLNRIIAGQSAGLCTALRKCYEQSPQDPTEHE